MPVTDLVDLARYPILDLDTVHGRALVDRSRTMLSATGACELAGFLTATGLGACLSDAQTLEGEAYASTGTGNAYLEAPDPSLPDDHPRVRRNPYAVRTVAYDQFPSASPIRTLYEWDPLLAFIGAVLDTAVHRYADPLGALNLAVMLEGDELQWHYDQTDFVVSLALQPSDVGGTFDVVPQLRADGEERYDEVGAVLDGDHDGVVTLPMTSGTLLVFAGRTSLHRVSPVAGDRARLVVLMGFDTRPGTLSTPLLQQARYGRVAS